MGLFSRREPWPYKCMYCKGPLQHKPGSEFCYCPKCDVEELKSQVINYWNYQSEEEEEEEEEAESCSYYPGYEDLVDEAARKGDTRVAFLSKDDPSLNPYQYSIQWFDSLSGGYYNYVCSSFSYWNCKKESYQVIGYFVHELDKDRSSKYHMHFKSKGIFSIFAGNIYARTKGYFQALDDHVKNSLTNLFRNDSKKKLEQKLRDRLSFWQRCCYGFDDFDYSNITCDLTLEVEYK